MNRATLLALASRVEAATAPDRGIEREIAIAVGWHFYDRKVDHTRPAIEQWWRPGATTPSTDFPRFMASLDDAMSLVPSGCFGAKVSSHTDCTGGATCWDSRGYPYSVNAATPALALTAACLRARAIAWSMTDD